MARDMILYNQHIAVEKRQEVDRQATELAGDTVYRDAWTLVFTDRATSDRVMITVTRDARDAIVNKLTDGRVLAGGELPRI